MADLGEVLNQHIMFDGNLWEILINKAGEPNKEQARFIEKNIEIVSGLVEEDEKGKEDTENAKPEGIKKTSHEIVSGATPGDAEGVSEHEPG